MVGYFSTFCSLFSDSGYNEKGCAPAFLVSGSVVESGADSFSGSEATCGTRVPNVFSLWGTLEASKSSQASKHLTRVTLCYWYYIPFD